MYDLSDIQFDNDVWWEAMDMFAYDDQITVLEISKKDLEDQNTDGIKEVKTVEMKDWESLASVVGEEEAKLMKLDFEEENLSYLVLLYCEGQYVTSIEAPAGYFES